MADETSSDLRPAHTGDALTRIDGEPAPPAPRKALPHVPYLRDEGFVGREDDLALLHRLLQTGGAVGVRPAALTGMGGIGKTQLAVEYAHRHAEAYPGGVYWVNAAGDDWRPALAKLAVDLDLEARDARDAERQLRLIAALAAYLRARPDALVIFDNVDRPADLGSDRCAGLVPASLGCRLLFTSRRREADSPFETVEVRVLPEDAALRLLLSGGTRRAILDGRKGELDAARTICASLGYLPLALVLAAAFLARYPRIALGEYLARIQREGALAVTDAAKVGPHTLGTRHDAAVGATLRTQWNAIESEDAKRVLKAAALLGEAAQVPRARLSLLTGLADGERTEPGYPAPMEEALADLGGLSLVEELTDQAIRLHPLVREFAETRIEGREDFGAQCAGNLGEALWDLGRLNDEVAARGVDAVLGDLRVGVRLSREGEAGWIERLVRPLDREAHCLRRWEPAERPELLLQQVRNRCFEMGEDEGRALAEEVLAGRGLPYLRERIRSGRESDALVRTLEGHTGDVTGVAVTADGRWVVSASDDKMLKVWELGSGQLVRTLKGLTEWVGDVAITADGRWAVSASSSDRMLDVWDLGSGKHLRTLVGHTDTVNGVAVTADGCWAVSASEDKTLKVWDLGSGLLLRTLEGHTRSVTGVAVTADARWAVSASYDETLKVWDLGSGQLVRTLEGHTDTVNGVAVTADGRWAVSASNDETLKVWELGSGQLVHTLEGHTSLVTGVAMTTDGLWAVSASWDKALKVWDLGTGQLVRTLEGHTDTVTGVAVTTDGRWAVSASVDNTLRVWDLGSEQLTRTFEGHTNWVTGVAVTTDGRWAVSASLDNTLKVWTLDSGQVVRTLEGHTDWVSGVAVTADGRWAVSTSGDKSLKVWDLGSGLLLHTLEGHTDTVNGVAVTADARWAVSASRDNTLKVWDLSSGQIVRTLEGHTDTVIGVAVTADARWAVSASRDNTLKVWDLSSGQIVRTLEGHTASVTGVAITADARWAVSASGDKTLKVWDLGSGQLVRTLEGHTGWLTGVAVTADARWAVSTSDDRSLRVWDLATGRAVAMLETHAPLTCCAVASDRLLLAGDAAGALHFLDWHPPGSPFSHAVPSRTVAPRRPLRLAPEVTTPATRAGRVTAPAQGPLLDGAAIHALYQAAVAAGLVHSRRALLAGMDAGFVANLPDASTPAAQLLSDLNELNRVPRLADGSVVLALWLSNAVSLAGPRKEAEVFRRALDDVRARVLAEQS